ncbi:MAG: hypothetical protein WAL39_17090 [Xanthobacteraceae bacterium]
MADLRGPTDVEIGLMDAITTIMDILLALGIRQSVLQVPLQFQRDAQRAAGRPNAAALLDYFVEFVIDPERQQHRETVELLRRESPKGTA